MATTKPKNASKYSDLTDEEKKEKYKEKVREWYANKTPEEKKAYMEKVAISKRGVCEICKTNRVYVDLPKHKKSQAHIRNVNNIEK